MGAGLGGEWISVVDLRGCGDMVGVVDAGTSAAAKWVDGTSTDGGIAGYMDRLGAVEVPAAICSSTNMSVSFRTSAMSTSGAVIGVSLGGNMRGTGGGPIELDDRAEPPGGVRITFCTLGTKGLVGGRAAAWPSSGRAIGARARVGVVLLSGAGEAGFGTAAYGLAGERPTRCGGVRCRAGMME